MKKLTQMKKTLNIMTTAALVVGVGAPMVAPSEASANSSNIVDRVLQIDDDYKSFEKVEDMTDIETGAANYLLIKEKDVEFTSGDTFRLSMPSGVKWLTDAYEDGQSFSNDNGAQFTVIQSTNQDLEFEITGDWQKGKETVQLPLYFEVDGAEGELKLTLDSKGSTLTSGNYTFAVVSANKTETSIVKVGKFSDSGGKVSTIRIDELAVGAMESGKEIELTLPSKYEWSGTAKVTFSGAYEGAPEVEETPDGRKLTITVPEVQDAKKLGSIFIDGLRIEIDRDATFGEIEMDITGEATNETLVVARYIDYKTSVKAEEAPTLIAGRNNADLDHLETAAVTIKESLANTWATGRNTVIEFPSWTKIVGYELVDTGKLPKEDVDKLFRDEVTGDDNVIEFNMPDGGKRSFEMKFYLSTKADAEGDVTVKFSGRSGVEGEAVVAKVISPISVEVTKTEVRTGVKNQPVGDILLTENTKAAFEEGKRVEVRLSDNVDYSKKPVVEVIEGDLVIDQDSVDVENGMLSFDIEHESRAASKIKISGVTVDLDRAVAQGDIEVEIGGDAIVQNADLSSGTAFEGSTEIGDKNYGSSFKLDTSLDVGEFDRDYVAKKAIATVVTPAEGNVTVNEVVFTVGQTNYTVGSVEKAMDVAPFIEAGRTYLPIRYVAQTVGVEDDNIIWDEATRQVTIVKDDRVVQLTVGSNVLSMNGVALTMDVDAKTVNGRTVLPLRAVAQALGAQVDWNESDQTITIQ